MKKYLALALPLFMLAALSLPAFSQEEGADTPAVGETRTEAPAKPAAKKAPARKKARKKKPEPPVSEYKFSGQETSPAYKFDKRANPIIKEPRKKKPAKKTSKKAAAAKEKKTPLPAVKLTPVKPIGAQDDQAQGKQSAEGE
jgi:hypothetical protein